MDTLEELNTDSPLALITWSSRTHVGMRRSENQDSLGEIETDNYKIFLVADGMGGVHGGAVASSLTIATIKGALESIENPTEQDLVNAVNAANQAVFNRGLEERTLNGMGTTLVGLLFFSNRLYCVNVGDSRAYLIRDGLAMQLTQDHTVVSELLRSGAIDENQVSNHPISHMLTRSIGPTAEINVDCYMIPNAPLAGDRFLLCSDGLYNHLDATEIAKIVENNEPEAACERLIELANERGGSDNITVVIIDVDPEYDTPTVAFDHTATNILTARLDQTATGTMQFNGYSRNQNDSGEYYEKLVTDPEHAKRTIKSGTYGQNVNVGNAPSGNIPKRFTPLGFSIIAIVVFMLWWAIDRGNQRIKGIDQVKVTSNDLNTTLPVADDESSSTKTLKPDLTVEQTSPADTLLEQPFTSERMEKARIRMKFLQERITGIETKLAAFDQPLSGAVAQNLSESTRKLDEIKDQISAIDGQLANTAKSLSVLYGQQQRMRSIELLKLAAEVSGANPEVEAQKRVFESASWRYLQEREKIERDPHNQELRDKVDELALARRQELDKLGEIVRQNIIAQTLKLDQQSAEFNKKKEVLELQLKNTQDELNYIYVLMSQDQNRRLSFRNSLEEDLNRQRAEFNTLQNMILAMLGEGTEQ